MRALAAAAVIQVCASAAAGTSQDGPQPFCCGGYSCPLSAPPPPPPHPTLPLPPPTRWVDRAHAPPSPPTGPPHFFLQNPLTTPPARAPAPRAPPHHP